ncbi:glycosyltransferase [Agilicoccus flavus]|uniref:glycosyltransferase n=1 Tax=Agilicoccus flavus TaxID=2775968 RepID=UPI001CF61EC2|nr:glycosyltransferase [Agilicoccus flavus]
MRILMLTNSYPTRHSPSGAAYITSRIDAFASLGDSGAPVDLTALALRPVQPWWLDVVRRVVRATPGAGLALADEERYGEVRVSWGVADVVRGRRGRRPEGAVRSAVQGVLAHPAVARARSGEEQPFDVVHAHGMYTMPAGEVARRVAAELGVPFVVSLHGSDVEVAARADPEAAAATLRQAAATTYVSDALRRTATGLGLPTATATVISNGVDLARFRPPADDSCVDPGRRPGTAGSPVRILFAGNLLPVKGADRLPALVGAIESLGGEADLTVAGDGPLRTSLTSRLPRARFTGRVPQDELARLMRSADVLVAPSRSEGWGCVVTEAYASGTPAVAFGVGGLPEALLGSDGLVPPPGSQESDDPDAEAAAIVRFARAVLDVAAAPPTADAMAAHVRPHGWADVARAELDVLRAAVGPA